MGRIQSAYDYSSKGYEITTKGNIILNQAVSGYEDLGNNTPPTHLVIVEWNNQMEADKFGKMDKNVLDKAETFYTHFDFPKE